jgi:hypothetical protein
LHAGCWWPTGCHRHSCWLPFLFVMQKAIGVGKRSCWRHECTLCGTELLYQTILRGIFLLTLCPSPLASQFQTARPFRHNLGPNPSTFRSSGTPSKNQISLYTNRRIPEGFNNQRSVITRRVITGGEPQACAGAGASSSRPEGGSPKSASGRSPRGGSPRGSEDSQSATEAILGAIQRLGSAALPRNPNLTCTCLICLEVLSPEEFEVKSISNSQLSSCL